MTTEAMTPTPAPEITREFSDKVKRLANHLIENSKKFSQIFQAETEQALSEKALAIQTYIQDNMGEYRRPAAELCSLLLGERITIGGTKIPEHIWRERVLMVPTTNPNSHNYPLKKPTLTLGNGSQRGYRYGDFSLGNNLPGDNSCYREATFEEACDFVEHHFDKLVSTLGVMFL